MSDTIHTRETLPPPSDTADTIRPPALEAEPDLPLLGVDLGTEVQPATKRRSALDIPAVRSWFEG